MTADYTQKQPERPPRASPHPSRPPPPRPEPPSAPPHAGAAPTTADFLNLTPQPGGQVPEFTQETKTEKKLKSNDSFDFFGMMEKPADSFGDFLSGAATDNAKVTFWH